MDHKAEAENKDGQRINLNEPYELQYWSKKLKVGRSILKQAIKEAGPIVKDVKRFLEENDARKLNNETDMEKKNQDQTASENKKSKDDGLNANSAYSGSGAMQPSGNTGRPEKESDLSEGNLEEAKDQADVAGNGESDGK